MKQARIYIISIGATFAFLLLIGNIYKLQIEKGDYYAARAASQYHMAGLLDPLRGTIYFTDRNDNKIPAAMIKEYPLIFAVPTEITDPQGIATTLSPIVGIDQPTLATMLAKPHDEYELLVRKATDDQVAKIEDLKIKGIYEDSEDLRFYPFGTLASQLLGFVGMSANSTSPIGRYGLELEYNDQLAGMPGKLNGNKIVSSTPGEDLQLTIDVNVQTRAEEILQNLIQNFKAEKGMVIVEDPATGKILAMGAFPNFDPNTYASASLNTYMNPMVQEVYEPGSVMKVITMAGGLDAGKLTPSTTFFDSGSLSLDGYTIRNWDLKAHGTVTMTQIIEDSLNTGAAYAERLVGPDLFLSYLKKFGFGEKTGIALPGELDGSLANLSGAFRPVNFATAAFGQGISVTPLQMIDAIGALANGGKLMRPYVVASDGPQEIRQVVSPEAAKEATDMMVAAVDNAGVTTISHYSVAGKTGTAQIPDFVHGGYLDNQFIHTYIGFAPAYNPKFIALIRIDKPDTELAGESVVPAFRDLAQFILNYYNVPPDRLNAPSGN
ncbi:MAG: penicillin-binding protein 2 [Patescibacteria group bacterium]|nr:penicillin-binding protein 2 [Patescibacteria group bacterium]